MEKQNEEVKENMETPKKTKTEEKSKSENSVEEVKKIKEKPVVKKEERLGIAYIFSSFNNASVHITDLAGNTISRVSGGMVTKHDRLKANPTTAMFVAKKAAERAKDVGITGLYIRMKGKTGATGIGPGAHAAVKTLGKEGFKIVSVLDSTKIPRGGPKKKGGRRGRRV